MLSGDQRPPPPSIDPASSTWEIGELLQTWIGIKQEQIDEAVAEAQVKAAAIPNQRVLWEMFGELVIRVTCLEADLAQLKKERRP